MPRTILKLHNFTENMAFFLITLYCFNCKNDIIRLKRSSTYLFYFENIQTTFKLGCQRTILILHITLPKIWLLSYLLVSLHYFKVMKLEVAKINDLFQIKFLKLTTFTKKITQIQNLVRSIILEKKKLRSFRSYNSFIIL